MKGEQEQNSLFTKNKLLSEIDAQQSSIVQFIPNKFYEDNSDAIHVMLNLLPNGLDPHFANEVTLLQQHFISAADIVSKDLAAQLQLKYMNILKAMSLITDLNNQIYLSTQNISILRQILQKADTEICQNPEQFFQQIQKQKNINTVLDLLNLVKQISESSDKLNQALQNNDFVSAIKLCLKPAELSNKIQKLTGVEHLISSLSNTYSRIIDKMDTALVSQTINFDRNIYDNLINAYDNLNKLNLIPQKLQIAFITRINTEFDSIIDSNDYKNISKFREVLKSFIKYCKSLLSTYRQIISYHRSTLKFNSIQSSVEKIIEIIWSKIENDLFLILQKIPFQKMNFDGFNSIINIVNDFMQYGSTIVDVSNIVLNQSINDIGGVYFKQFHHNALDSILESIKLDTWTTIPTNVEFEHQILSFKIISNFSHSISTIQIQPPNRIDLSLSTNSCITVIKFIHQYITILNSIPSLSVEIIQSICEMAEYYSFSILNAILNYSPIKPFIFDHDKQCISYFDCSALFPNDGLQFVSRIAHHLTNKNQYFTFPLKLNIEDNDKLNFSQIAITAKNNMNSISWYLNSIKGILEDNLPSGSIGSFRRFYADFVANFLDNFALFSFQYIIPKIVDLNPYIRQIKEIKFNKDSQCNEQHQFSKTWISIADLFITKLKNANFNENDIILLSKAFWTCSSFFATNEISLMQNISKNEKSSLILDFSIMAQYLKKTIGNNIGIGNNLIVEYINASFLCKNDFILWAESNFSKYTFNQLIAIVDTGLADKIGKKEKAQIQEKIKKLFKELSI